MTALLTIRSREEPDNVNDIQAISAFETRIYGRSLPMTFIEQVDKPIDGNVGILYVIYLRRGDTPRMQGDQFTVPSYRQRFSSVVVYRAVQDCIHVRKDFGDILIKVGGDADPVRIGQTGYNSNDADVIKQ